MSHRSEVSIVGAGMSGCMMAVYLAQQKRKIDLFERRSDMRGESVRVGRSINLTLAARAIAALDEVGLKDAVLRLTVPLLGRMVHRSNGQCTFQPYGNAPFDKIYSITRGLLNNVLLDAVAEYDNVTMRFNKSCIGVDKANRRLSMHDTISGQSFQVEPDLLIGADGGFSAVCDALQQGEIASRHQEFLDWGYKELVFPARPDGSHSMEGNVLHIWPRGNCVLLAMPNPDGTYTGTLCLPFEGPVSFRSLADRDSWRRFCEAEFPDALRVSPTMVDDLFTTQPSGFLTVTTDPWYYKDWAVLIGDACHTVLPFYGQGMNAAFQDCSYLASQLRASSDRERVFRKYQDTRKPNTDTLAALSKQNFVELRDSVRSPVVGYRKKMDLFLNRCMPRTWVPLYTLISHTTVPYVDAVAKAERQRRILRWTGVDAGLRAAGFLTALTQPRIRTHYDEPAPRAARGTTAAAAAVGALIEPAAVRQEPLPAAVPVTPSALVDRPPESAAGAPIVVGKAPQDANGALPIAAAYAAPPPRVASPAPADTAEQAGASPPSSGTTSAVDAGSAAPNGASAAKPPPPKRGTLYTLYQFAKGLSVWTIALAALAGALTGGGRAAILAVINSAIAAPAGHVNDHLLTFVALAFVLLGAQVLSRLLLIRLSQDLVYDLRMRLSRQILAAPLRQVEQTGAARLLSAMTDDVSVLANMLLSVPALSIHVSTIVVCMAYLGWLSPAGLGSLALVMFIGALSYQFVVSRGLNRFRQAREDQNRLFGFLRSVTDGGKEFKLNANRQQAFVSGRLEPTASSYRSNSIVGNGIYSFATSWGQFIFFGYIGVLLFLVAGLQDMNRDTLTGFTLVVLYVIIPLEMMLTMIPQFAGAKVAVENIQKIGLAPEGPADALRDAGVVPPLRARWRQLDIAGVEKSYQQRGRGFRLGPISLSLRPGELVFVMGGNGSGKSTLAKLVTGLYSPDSGEIRLDGDAVDDGNRDRYRQMFSAVFSDFHLLDGLQGVDPSAFGQRAQTLLERLQLTEVVDIRNGVFSTTDLSTGQRKRLALLIALLEERPIYVFDEWAADQDPEFKAIFYTQILPELAARGKAVFVITHDERYAHVADRLLKLEDGRLSPATEMLALAAVPRRADDATASDPLAALTASQILMRPFDASADGLRDSCDARVYENGGILATIGNTPMVRLRKALGGVPFRLMAKLETTNPGGSIKDRSAQQIIEDALAEGLIDAGTTIVEASSGNMGIGLAQICVYHGLRFVCVVDKRTTDQNIQIMRAYGATVDVVTEPDPRTGDLLQAKLDRVQNLLDSVPNSFWPNQYANPSNARSHHATMREIVAQCGGKVDYVFCATSTCGTLRGCVEYVREHGLSTRIVAVDAIGSVIFGGPACHRLLPGHGTARVPELFSPNLTDRYVQVSDLDCVVGCRRLLREESILAGGSSGGILMAVEALRDEIPPDATCVIVLPDRGERYLNTIYSDSWVQRHLGAALVDAKSDLKIDAKADPKADRSSAVELQ